MHVSVAPRTDSSRSRMPILTADSTGQSYPVCSHRPVEAPRPDLTLWRNQSAVGAVGPDLRITVVGPIAPHTRLLQPLILSVEQEHTPSGAQFIVSEPYLDTYGAGPTLREAVDDYKSMLLDLYQELEDSRDILSPALLRRLHYLRTILVAD